MDHDEPLTISRTSANTADADPIVLRQTQTTRLLFRPILLENPHDADATIDGCFIFQRKSQKDTWEDHTELPLSRLKAGEWVKLELKAAEVLTLYQELGNYYRLVAEHGLGRGTQQFVPAPTSEPLRRLLLDDVALSSVLAEEDLAVGLLSGLIRWLGRSQTTLAEVRVEGVSVADLQRFDALISLARLRRFCRELDDNRSNDDEAYWQRTLTTNSWVIAQVYAIPLMLVQGQVYVGGKRLTNRGGNTADFLFQNQLTGNVVIVEMKTPATPLVSTKFRNNVYNVAGPLIGATLQALKAKKGLLEEYRALQLDSGLISQRSLSPRGLLIVGSVEHSQLNESRLESFELYRNNQRDIDIVTFDELRQKTQTLVDMLERVGNTAENG